MPKGKYCRKHLYTPGESAYKRLYNNNHYKSKGLDYQLFRQLCIQDCYYCGAKPRKLNPFTNSGLVESGKSRQEWIDDQEIVFNGIDKKTHAEDYTDKSNLVTCCQTCNFMKQRIEHDQFVQHIKQIYKHQERI